MKNQTILDAIGHSRSGPKNMHNGVAQFSAQYDWSATEAEAKFVAHCVKRAEGFDAGASDAVKVALYVDNQAYIDIQAFLRSKVK